MQSKESDVSIRDFWTDERMKRCGFSGGLTQRLDGDMKADIANRKRLLGYSKLSEGTALFLSQVHGTKIFRANSKIDGSLILEGDGWICDEPGVLPCILVADCLPVFIWSRSERAFGIFHAGWKGLAAGFARLAALEMTKAFGLNAKDLMASVGPHLGACCYQVGPEMKKFFPSEDFVSDKAGLRLDLNLEAKNQLLRGGLSNDSISLSSGCTVCSGDYFSYRNGEAERMAAFMAVSQEIKP
jgi:hypothetical protein